ncbi:TonB-dependent receptor [candidate division WOR-3 bacterium]|nr:TonB-dependent receptor [candidate division WOR-3 bacterium]
MKPLACILLYPAILLLSQGVLHSQTSEYNIVGYVYDAVSGVGLPGVNLVLEGTTMGASTDLDGAFKISGIKSGVYTLTATMMGYKNKSYRLDLSGDKTVRTDFYLEEKVIEMKGIEVVGERPMIEKDMTASQRVMDKRTLEALPIQDVRSALTTRAGISGEGTDIHIRGGRSNEILTIVDGMPIRDPLSGSAFGMYLPISSVSEVEALTGGFNAEYGQAMSGVVEVRLKEGGDIYHGEIEFSSTTPFGYSENIMILQLEGPEFLTKSLLPIFGIRMPGRVSFFSNLYIRFSDTYLPHADNLYSSVFKSSSLSPCEENTMSGVLKFTWSPSNKHKFALSFSRSMEINQGYFLSRSDYPFSYGFPYRYINILDNYPTFTRDGNQITISYHSVPALNTFYDIKFSRFFTNLHIDVAGKHWSEYDELLDIFPVGDTLKPAGDGFWDVGDAPYWHDHYVETYTGKFDLSRAISSLYNVKVGLTLQSSEIQWIDIHYPWFASPGGLGLNQDIYRAREFDGGVYFQNQITFAGMIANLGARLDFWVPGRYLEDGVRSALQDEDIPPIVEQQYSAYLNENPKIPFTDYHIKAHLSPRVGISYPVTDRDKVFFSYGHFSQLPDRKFVYSKLGRRATSTYELVGNPNLNQTITVAYELGLEHLFGEYTKLVTTAYYKDVFNYPTALKVPGIPPNPDFWMYFNSDYSRSLGIEITLERRLFKNWYADIELTISQSKGRTSTAEDIYWRGEEETLKEWYLKWDRPIKFFGSVAYILNEDEKLNILGITIPGDLRANFSLSLQSGRRYTPQDNYGNRGEVNSGIGPYWSRADIGLEKGMKIFGLKLKLFFEGKNIFNHRNVYYINPITGRDYRLGDPLPPYTDEEDMLSPARYREGRKLRLGLVLEL